MVCSLPGCSVHGILQARILEWITIPFTSGSSWPRGWTQVSCISGRVITIWTTRKAQLNSRLFQLSPVLVLFFFFPSCSFSAPGFSQGSHNTFSCASFDIFSLAFSFMALTLLMRNDWLLYRMCPKLSLFDVSSRSEWNYKHLSKYTIEVMFFLISSNQGVQCWCFITDDTNLDNLIKVEKPAVFLHQKVTRFSFSIERYWGEIF